MADEFYDVRPERTQPPRNFIGVGKQLIFERQCAFRTKGEELFEERLVWYRDSSRVVTVEELLFTRQGGFQLSIGARTL